MLKREGVTAEQLRQLLIDHGRAIVRGEQVTFPAVRVLAAEDLTDDGEQVVLPAQISHTWAQEEE